VSSPKPRPVAKVNEASVRQRLASAHETATLRDLGAAIGITHYTVRKFLLGGAVRPNTLRRIASWLDAGASEEGLAFRDLVHRVLRGLPAHRTKQAERDIGRAISKALDDEGLKVPEWIRGLGA